MIVGGPACVNTEAVTDPALPRPMSEDYQAPSGAGHPIPPPELVEQWRNQAPWDPAPASLEHAASIRQCWIATQAARWGADQELEACCEALARELICDGKHVATDLRSVRRPKPPSLAKQAMEAQQRAWNNSPTHADWEVIRRALERLQELEGNG